MTLKNFISENKTKFKSLKKLTVRDLDEISENTFVAYVDDENDSFDVQLVFDSKRNMLETSCDCKVGGTCNHIIALANFIFENKSEKTVIKKTTKKKLSETDSILESLSNDELRIWISELLNKNKEIAFAFKNSFGNKNIVVTKDSIEKIIQESISSVIGKRKKCETNEVKKIVDALNLSLKSTLDFIYSKVNQENNALLEHLIFKLEEFHYNYYLTSNRILKLIENLNDLQLKNLYKIKDHEEWQKSAKFYLDIIVNEKFMLRDLNFIQKIYEFSKSNELQKKYILLVLEENFKIIYNSLEENFVMNFEIENFYLQLFSENNLIQKYIHFFKPRRFRNEYNLILINELIKLNQTNIAENICLDQIEENYKQEYQLPYVKVLVIIYKNNNDNHKLANILSEYGKYLFDIENYIFIKENAQIEKFKKYRQSVLTNARYAYQSGDIDAFNFYFEIKKLDDKSSDLFEMLNNSNNLAFVNEYKEIAHQIDEIKFIKTITNMYIYSPIYKEDLSDTIQYILDKIEIPTIEFYLKNIKPYYGNPIYHKLKGILNL